MSAAGRLWRRAPAWRVCLVGAVACTVLAAMFPPPLPSADGLRRLAARAGLPGAPPDAAGPSLPGASDTGQARFKPAPDPAPAGYSAVGSPPLGEGRSGPIPFAGRMLPLPPGSWQELVLARSNDAPPLQLSVLDRVAEGRLTGLMLVEATAPMTDLGIVEQPTACVSPEIVARRITAGDTASDPFTHECWALTAASLAPTSLAPTSLAGDTSRARQNPLIDRALRRLAANNVAVPDTMMALQFVRTDAHGAMDVTIFLPARGPVTRAATRPEQEWADRYLALLRKGFAGTLAGADMKEIGRRDP
ncbi:hypothetical protein [Rhizosaccharibacter radicis]|uniref:Uncharacterized protein n=1 Tax=Rhizosaccharibacter radicis TaxID=2782605 RepID=A0ABT1VZ37_9PROT|nr:hypothetical protein [Acetobacteraceae bacterium KSS12]